MVRERFYKTDQPKTKHQVKYARSKAKLREAMTAIKASNVEFKKRNADLYNEVERLRGLATAVREYLSSDKEDPFLREAAEHAGIFETGPGMPVVLRKKHSDDWRREKSDGEALTRSKDPLTEMYYQQDQKALAQDGWQPFSVGDDKWEKV